MIYKFLLLSDEVDVFSREIEIDSNSTFLDLHNAIVESVNYEKGQMASFFICNDDWEKEQEITLMEMDTSSEYDNLTMENTVICDYVSEEGQKLLYVFDYFSERGFFIRLKSIKPGHVEKAVCVSKKGKAPEQIVIDNDLNNIIASATAPNAENIDEDFYGNDGFNEDEFDEEGFSDMSFEDENF